MTEDKQVIAHLTECTLATLGKLLMKKKPLKGETSRQARIALVGLQALKGEAVTHRVKEVLETVVTREYNLPPLGSQLAEYCAAIRMTFGLEPIELDLGTGSPIWKR